MDLGISQRELGVRLGVSKSTIEHWEGEKTTPSRLARPQIGRFLGDDSPGAPATLAERLTARRRALRLSQGQLARMLGVDRCTVNRWETGKTSPDVRHIPSIIEFLGSDTLPAGETVGQRIRATRERQGLSRERLAKGFSP